MSGGEPAVRTSGAGSPSIASVYFEIPLPPSTADPKPAMDLSPRPMASLAFFYTTPPFLLDTDDSEWEEPYLLGNILGKVANWPLTRYLRLASRITIMYFSFLLFSVFWVIGCRTSSAFNIGTASWAWVIFLSSLRLF